MRTGEAGGAGDIVQEPVEEEQNQDTVPAVDNTVMAKVQTQGNVTQIRVQVARFPVVCCSDQEKVVNPGSLAASRIMGWQ